MYSTILQYNLVKMSYWIMCNIYQSFNMKFLFFFSTECLKSWKILGDVTVKCHFCITIISRIANIVVVSEQVSWTHWSVKKIVLPPTSHHWLSQFCNVEWLRSLIKQQCFDNTFFGKIDLQMTLNIKQRYYSTKLTVILTRKMTHFIFKLYLTVYKGI